MRKPPHAVSGGRHSPTAEADLTALDGNLWRVRIKQGGAAELASGAAAVNVDTGGKMNSRPSSLRQSRDKVVAQKAWTCAGQSDGLPMSQQGQHRHRGLVEHSARSRDNLRKGWSLTCHFGSVAACVEGSTSKLYDICEGS